MRFATGFRGAKKIVDGGILVDLALAVEGRPPSVAVHRDESR